MSEPTNPTTDSQIADAVRGNYVHELREDNLVARIESDRRKLAALTAERDTAERQAGRSEVYTELRNARARTIAAEAERDRYRAVVEAAREVIRFKFYTMGNKTSTGRVQMARLESALVALAATEEHR